MIYKLLANTRQITVPLPRIFKSALPFALEILRAFVTAVSVSNVSRVLHICTEAPLSVTLFSIANTSVALKAEIDWSYTAPLNLRSMAVLRVVALLATVETCTGRSLLSSTALDFLLSLQLHIALAGKKRSRLLDSRRGFLAHFLCDQLAHEVRQVESGY